METCQPSVISRGPPLSLPSPPLSLPALPGLAQLSRCGEMTGGAAARTSLTLTARSSIRRGAQHPAPTILPATLPVLHVCRSPEFWWYQTSVSTPVTEAISLVCEMSGPLRFSAAGDKRLNWKSFLVKSFEYFQQA